MKNKLKINALITVVTVIVCVILVNLVAGAITSKLPIEIDFTKTKIYDFSEQTKTVMSELDKDVKVYALFPDNVTTDYLNYVKEYLEKYEEMSDKFFVEIVDPYTEPAFLSKYAKDGDSIGIGSIIVDCNGKFRVISYESLFDSDSYTSEVLIDMETKLTSAVIYVTGSGKEVKIYFTTGHGETSCPNLSEFLVGEGYACEELNISKYGIPDDASVIFIGAPYDDFTLEEINALDSFSDKGGNIILAAPLPGVIMPQNLASYIMDWGLEFGNDQIIENDTARMINTSYGAAPAPAMQNHAITEKIIVQKAEYVSPESSSIVTHVNNTYGAVHSPLLSSSKKSTSLSFVNSEEKEGPFNVAVLATRVGTSGEQSNILAIGSLVSLESPALIAQSTYANSDFILNSVASVTKSTNVLEIRPKKISSESLTMTKAQVNLTYVVLLYVLPILIFAAGIVVWIRRRYL